MTLSAQHLENHEVGTYKNSSLERLLYLVALQSFLAQHGVMVHDHITAIHGKLEFFRLLPPTGFA